MELIAISALIAIALLVLELTDFILGEPAYRQAGVATPEFQLATLAAEPTVQLVGPRAAAGDLDRAA